MNANHGSDWDSARERFRAGDYPEALRLAHAMPAACLETDKWRIFAGHCLYEMDRLDDALAVYTAGAQTAGDSNNKTILTYHRGLVLLELNRYAEAAEILGSLDPKYDKVEALLGEAMYFLGVDDARFFGKAIAHLESWLARCPSDGLSWYYLGACRNMEDKHAEALGCMFRALDAGFVSKASLNGLLVELRWNGRESELSACLDRYVPADCDKNSALRKAMQTDPRSSSEDGRL